MNAERIRQRMDEYFEKTTPEQIIKDFEALGVEFVDIKDLTMIEQLKQSPKWTEFTNWYSGQYPMLLINWGAIYYSDFLLLPFEFQKGVFEKFIEYNSHIQRHTDATEWYLWTEKFGNEYFETFEQLLIHYFNEI